MIVSWENIPVEGAALAGERMWAFEKSEMEDVQGLWNWLAGLSRTEALQ